MLPFRDVNIFPSHFNNAAVVAWIVDPRIRDAEFYVYRRVDEGGDWELLNTDPVFGSTYTDTGFSVRNKLSNPGYKILAVLNGKEFVSPDITLYSRTGRKAYGVARTILRSKYLQARLDGIPVLYYPLARNGKTNESLDPDTGQRVKASCPKGLSADEQEETGEQDDYGTYYADGYCRPYITYMRLLGEYAQKENVLDNGVYDASTVMVELLSFPYARTDDMIVDVATDRRWKVGDNIQTSLVKGVIPVCHKVKISLQAHNDPCYAVPIPDNYYDLKHRLDVNLQ